MTDSAGGKGEIKFFLPKDFAYYPSRITEARIARGISPNKIASILGITKETLSRVELGLGSLDEKDIMRLSRIVELPLQFFSKCPEPIKPGSIGNTFFCTPNRDLDS